MPNSPPTHKPLPVKQLPCHRPPQRPRAKTAARGYDARWRRLRLWKLSNDPLCEECTRNGLTVGANIVDHIVPMRQGGARLDRANLQSLCKQCHDRKTATEDGGFGRN